MNEQPQKEETTKPNNKKIKWIIAISIFAICLVTTIIILLLSTKTNSFQADDQNTNQIDNDEATNSSKLEIVEETLSPFTKEDLELLGVYNLPSNYSIQHEYKEVIFTQTTNISYTEEQINILEAIIDRAPSRLVENGPIVFVISTREDLSMGYALGVAHASGPYIFIDEDTFDLGGSWYDNSIDQIYNSIYHELMHVAQFKELYKDISPEELMVDVGASDLWTSMTLRTELFDSFAEITGWEKVEYDYTDHIRYTIKDRKAEKTTAYGRGKIEEDMADTVAGVYIGKGNLFSDERVKWAEEFLGLTYEEMIIGSLPYMTELEVTKISSLPSQFSNDTKKSSQGQGKYVDVLFLSSEKDTDLKIVDVLNYYEEQMELRGWEEMERRTNEFDNSIIRYSYIFHYDNTVVTLEFLNYSEADGYLIRPPDVLVRIIREISQ